LLASPESGGANGTTRTWPCDLGDHQPVRRRLGRIEERLGAPHDVNVVDPEVRMLEGVRGLAVDLERVVVIEEVDVE
jgi:hypothetical protein